MASDTAGDATISNPVGVFHATWPVARSTSYTLPSLLPTYTSSPTIVGDDRTGPPVMYFQRCTPEPASNARTLPSSLPTTTTLPATAGDEKTAPPVAADHCFTSCARRRNHCPSRLRVHFPRPTTKTGACGPRSRTRPPQRRAVRARRRRSAPANGEARAAQEQHHVQRPHLGSRRPRAAVHRSVRANRLRTNACAAAARATAKSPMVAKRSSGSRASAVMTTASIAGGTSGATFVADARHHRCGACKARSRRR